MYPRNVNGMFLEYKEKKEKIGKRVNNGVREVGRHRRY